MNKLGISKEKANEYILKAKDQVNKAIERKQAIERRGELYKGELQRALDDIKAQEEMLKLIQDNT